MGEVQPASRPCLSTSQAELNSPRSTKAQGFRSDLLKPRTLVLPIGKARPQSFQLIGRRQKAVWNFGVGNARVDELAENSLQGGERNSFRLGARNEISDECLRQGAGAIVRIVGFRGGIRGLTGDRLVRYGWQDLIAYFI